MRAERARAAAAGEAPDFSELVAGWGGVSLVYRKAMADSPAYRLNHEEISKFFEEGVRFVEKLSPLACVPDERGALAGVEFERRSRTGKWRHRREVKLPARTLFVAAGTSPNMTYERERPGHRSRSIRRRKAFQAPRAVRDDDGSCASSRRPASEVGFFTCYLRERPHRHLLRRQPPGLRGLGREGDGVGQGRLRRTSRRCSRASIAGLGPDGQPARDAAWQAFTAQARRRAARRRWRGSNG